MCKCVIHDGKDFPAQLTPGCLLPWLASPVQEPVENLSHCYTRYQALRARLSAELEQQGPNTADSAASSTKANAAGTLLGEEKLGTSQTVGLIVLAVIAVALVVYLRRRK